MTNILITRAFELIFMVIFAVGLVFAGFYVAGAVIGTAVGFMAALAVAVYLFREMFGEKYPNQKNFFQEHKNFDF